MADGERRDQREGYTYDAVVKGADTTFWANVEGAMAAVAGKLRVNADEIASYLQHRFGRFIFAINVPTIPAAGTTRLWGLRNVGAPTRGAAYFEQDTSTTVLFARSYDNSGTLQSTSITADTDWYGAEVEYIINWEKDRIQFQVNDSDGYRTLATHVTRVGTLPLALNVMDTVAENLDVGYVTVDYPELVV